MARKSSAMGRSRDIGLSHGAGKGDAPRSNFSNEWRNNFDFTGMHAFGMDGDDPTFKRVSVNRITKNYGRH